MNFLSTADGIRIWSNVLQLASAGRFAQSSVGRSNFAEVPPALEALERRETTGLPSSGPGAPEVGQPAVMSTARTCVGRIVTTTRDDPGRS